MKHQSIQRMKLQAVMYGARSKQSIVDNLDSKNELSFGMFRQQFCDDCTELTKYNRCVVANKVVKILDGPRVDQWRHVEGTLNPANIGTRKNSVRELEEREWFTGRACLRKNKDA